MSEAHEASTDDKTTLLERPEALGPLQMLQGRPTSSSSPGTQGPQRCGPDAQNCTACSLVLPSMVQNPAQLAASAVPRKVHSRTGSRPLRSLPPKAHSPEADSPLCVLWNLPTHFQRIVEQIVMIQGAANTRCHCTDGLMACMPHCSPTPHRQVQPTLGTAQHWSQGTSTMHTTR